MTLDNEHDLNNGRQGATVNTDIHLLITTSKLFHPPDSLNPRNKYHVAQILLIDITFQLDLRVLLLSQRLRHPFSPSLRSPNTPSRPASHFSKKKKKKAVARLNTVIIMMLLQLIMFFLVVAVDSINTTTCKVTSQAFASNTSSSATLIQGFTSNVTFFAPLAAPLYHNITVGEAWVYPSSANDLGARDMSCECFNPDGEFHFLGSRVDLAE